ncbi:hypothetical protein EDB84DRAFT_1439993 [Lactarius hengduanensis]|nr:hypothetical protein EDB84DRAFT_1439993 [Lactarius hengduanensis]
MGLCAPFHVAPRLFCAPLHPLHARGRRYPSALRRGGTHTHVAPACKAEGHWGLAPVACPCGAPTGEEGGASARLPVHAGGGPPHCFWCPAHGPPLARRLRREGEGEEKGGGDPLPIPAGSPVRREPLLFSQHPPISPPPGFEGGGGKLGRGNSRGRGGAKGPGKGRGQGRWLRGGAREGTGWGRERRLGEGAQEVGGKRTGGAGGANRGAGRRTRPIQQSDVLFGFI